REIRLWLSLDHENVLKMHGILTRDDNPFPCLVSDYMENETADRYLCKPGTNLIHMICDIAKGLSYIHSRDIAHGDIKANNVLVSSDGRGRIGDFGLSRMLGNNGLALEVTSSDCQRCNRWMAVEYASFDTEGKAPSGPTKPGDVWSFGCTILVSRCQRTYSFLT
ncbi:kinase-like protein, partial [Fomitiporia mediterranea MF3/22]|uniref:kinase-like protein n=1 Tax=Fomitiporia mediterranea (strain MF3/22) TaxID=694068 RepID=UPI00044076BC